MANKIILMQVDSSGYMLDCNGNSTGYLLPVGFNYDVHVVEPTPIPEPMSASELVEHLAKLKAVNII